MLNDAIVVRDSRTIHGTGLVAARCIAAGEWVWRADPGARRVPCNEVLSWSPERQREFQKVGWQADEGSFEVCDDASRYMNHSCDPNTWWGGEGLLVARRDIAPGEEVTYDYATSELALSPGITCACKCAGCRGHITNRDWEDPGWQARYAGHLPAHVREAIAARGSIDMLLRLAVYSSSKTVSDLLSGLPPLYIVTWFSSCLMSPPIDTTWCLLAGMRLVRMSPFGY